MMEISKMAFGDFFSIKIRVFLDNFFSGELIFNIKLQYEILAKMTFSRMLRTTLLFLFYNFILQLSVVFVLSKRSKTMLIWLDLFNGL
jgi:hypothetical protein